MSLSPFLSSLRCFRCGAEQAADPRAYTCPSCAGRDGPDPGILDVRYDYERAAPAMRAALEGAGADAGVFRYAPVLPAARIADDLAAGGTPLVSAPRLAASLGLAGLRLKDETRNPTRCLKDRATAVLMAVTDAAGAGAEPVYCASAGNAAISLAGFAAHRGRRCHVYVPSYASATRLDWLRRFGAGVRVSAGDYDQAFEESEQEGARNGWFSRNCAMNPYLVEGKKTVGWEIAEQLGWSPPDLVIAPVGDGCTLAAVGKGFRETRTMGFTSRLPRLVAVQAESTQPIVERLTGRAAPAGIPQSAASSIVVRRPRNALRLLQELRESGGTALAVSDAEIAGAQRRLAAEAGVVCEFTSAATLAALEKLARNGNIAGRTAVLVITGGRVDS